MKMMTVLRLNFLLNRRNQAQIHPPSHLVQIRFLRRKKMLVNLNKSVVNYFKFHIVSSQLYHFQIFLWYIKSKFYYLELESSDGSEEDEIIDLSGDDVDIGEDGDESDDPIVPREPEDEDNDSEEEAINEEYEPLKFTNAEDVTNEDDYEVLTTTTTTTTTKTSEDTSTPTTNSETSANASPPDSNDVGPIETVGDDVIGAKARYYYILFIFAEIRTEIVFQKAKDF